MQKTKQNACKKTNKKTKKNKKKKQSLESDFAQQLHEKRMRIRELESVKIYGKGRGVTSDLPGNNNNNQKRDSLTILDSNNSNLTANNVSHIQKQQSKDLANTIAKNVSYLLNNDNNNTNSMSNTKVAHYTDLYKTGTAVTDINNNNNSNNNNNVNNNILAPVNNTLNNTKSKTPDEQPLPDFLSKLVCGLICLLCLFVWLIVCLLVFLCV